MAVGSIVDFVPARHPEAVRMDASHYKIIRPQHDVAASSEDEDLSSKDESPSETSDISSMESSGFDPSDSDHPIEESTHSIDTSRKLEAKECISSSLGTSTTFYDINEYSNDRGTREPQRIHKSWPASIKSTIGLENQGVTCYQNAAIQALLHVPAVGRYLLEVLNNQYPKVGKTSVTHELALLFKKLIESRHQAVYPYKMIQRLDDINPMLSEWNQEDSHEYYMSLISRLQEDSVPKGEKLSSSIICDIFAGSVTQKVTCSQCETVSVTDQDFYDLPVSFSPQEDASANYTLEQSIKDFFTPEVIEASGENSSGYQCEKCRKKTQAVKQIAIKEAPEYLTVHIKRFKMENNVSKKVKDDLRYPLEMDLTEYEITDKSQQPLRYKLLSVIIHEGRTLSSGHYIAYTRQPNGTWAIYDDEHIRKIKESEAVSQSSAYILVYSRLLEKPQSRASREKAEKVKAQKRIRDERDNERKQKKRLKEIKKKEVKELKPKSKSKPNTSHNKITPASEKSRPHAQQVKRLSAFDIEDIFNKRRKH